ncbi:50S ribosomal protein L32e [Stygiolobus caldivivus]|uniref:Large ribosomal subunit protein eL32 n=1 Tax=Stygiolobus caldivivus TaxID=2824673 RepID=A0A8D5U7B5_9CREN|nr:50S ribosomal protein L32e [Stygiolobus caldivivus]BCU70654.1 50S ribosomal protein L32e [Stygiolobus caldivivus]
MKSNEVYKIKKEIRQIRSKKIEFYRYDWDKYYRIGRQETWRKPRGIDNAMRLELKGYPPKVKIGYGSPKEIKGLHPSGLKPILISSMKELERVKDQKDKVIVIIKANLGLKKRLELLKRADELGIRIANR